MLVSVMRSSKMSFKRTNGHIDPEQGMSKHIQRSNTMARFFESVEAMNGPPAKRRRVSRIVTVTDQRSLRAYGEEVTHFVYTCDL